MSHLAKSPTHAHSTDHGQDSVLRPGDIFKLRSVKFPDFELGLTSVKVRDEYCYLGLRKEVIIIIIISVMMFIMT
jgi:hypothetical protein